MADSFVTVESTIPTVIARLDRMAAVAQTETRALLERSVAAAVAIYKPALIDATPVGRSEDGEHLKDTTDEETVITAEGAVVRFRQTKTVYWKKEGDYPLARFLVDGTTAHPIDAAEGGWLYFEYNGKLIRKKHVEHPGTSADDYPGRAMDSVRSALDASFAAEADAVAQSVVRSLAA